MTISLKSKKQIRGLQKRGSPPGTTAAESATHQNATKMECEIKNNSREDENERHVNSGFFSEDIEGVTIDHDVEKTGGNKKEKIGEEDEIERKVHGGVVNKDIEGAMTNIAIEQTGGHKGDKVGKEDEQERNVHSGTVSEDYEGVMTDTEIKQTGGNKEDKIGREDETERNACGKEVDQDSKGLMTDTETVQTGGNKEKKTGKEVEKERNVHSGTVSGDYEGVMTDTEIKQTGGNKEDKIGIEDETERNACGKEVDQDSKCVMTDTETVQTGGNKEKKTGEEDENERNVLGGEVSEDTEVETIDTEKEQTLRKMNAMKMKCDGDLDSDDTDQADEVTLKHLCTIASAENMFCNKVMLSSRQWNNANVKDLKPQEFDCQNFQQYLSFSVPKPLLRVNSVERMLIYQSSGYSTSHSNNCLRAFLIKAIPPVQVCSAAAKDFSSLTFPGDVLPQFTGTCHSSIRNRTRFAIQCVVCPLYQERCTRQGVFSKLSSCGDKDLDGISQAVIHHKLRLHQSTLAYFSGSSATATMVESNADRDVPQTHQITIFQALKLKEPNTTNKVAHCLGFFENQEIVESYKDSSGIRRMTAKK